MKNTLKIFKPVVFTLLFSFLLFSCKPAVVPTIENGAFDEGSGKISLGTINLNMIKIEGGHDVLGYSESPDNPQHFVELSQYQISETQISQELFGAVMGYNPSHFNKNPNGSEIQGRRPVDSVNWYEAVEFCNKLTEKVMGKDHCVYKISDIVYYQSNEPQTGIKKATVEADWSKKGFRLPTEAEWEHAAKGGEPQYFYAGSNNLAETAWCYDNSKETHEVKKRKPNGYKLYDMIGNVWEWCWDLSGPIEKNKDYGKDPKGHDKGVFRIHKGASYYCPAPESLIDNRYTFFFRDAFVKPDIRDKKIGIRIARSL